MHTQTILNKNSSPRNDLETNLRHTEAVLNHTKDLIDKSSTIPGLLTSEKTLINQHIYKMRFSGWSLRRSILDFFCAPDLTHISALYYDMRIHIHNVEEYTSLSKVKIGNCGEIAFLGMRFCLENNISFKFIELKNLDHSFIVIGESHEVSDEWPLGVNAAVCDGLLKKVYPATAKNLSENLRDFCVDKLEYNQEYPTESFQEKNNILNDCIKKLEILEKIANKLPVTNEINSFLKNISISKISINAQDQITSESSYHLEKRLSELVRNYLKKIYPIDGLTNELIKTLDINEVEKLLTHEIVNYFAFTVKDLQNNKENEINTDNIMEFFQDNKITVKNEIRQLCSYILTFYHKSIAMPFIEKINDFYLIENCIIYHKFYYIDLFQMTVNWKDEEYLKCLITSISDKMLYLLLVRRIIRNLHDINDSNLNFLHLVAFRGWHESLTMILKRTSSQEINKICMLTLNNDKTLIDLIIEDENLKQNCAYLLFLRYFNLREFNIKLFNIISSVADLNQLLRLDVTLINTLKTNDELIYNTILSIENEDHRKKSIGILLKAHPIAVYSYFVIYREINFPQLNQLSEYVYSLNLSNDQIEFLQSIDDELIDSLCSEENKLTIAEILQSPLLSKDICRFNQLKSCGFTLIYLLKLKNEQILDLLLDNAYEISSLLEKLPSDQSSQVYHELKNLSEDVFMRIPNKQNFLNDPSKYLLLLGLTIEETLLISEEAQSLLFHSSDFIKQLDLEQKENFIKILKNHTLKDEKFIDMTLADMKYQLNDLLEKNETLILFRLFNPENSHQALSSESAEARFSRS